MDGKKVERRKKKRKEEDELNSSWRKSGGGGGPFPWGYRGYSVLCRILWPVKDGRADLTLYCPMGY